MRNAKKKTYLNKFRRSSLFKDIKTRCNLPATSKKPNDSFSIAFSLMKRENGLTGHSLGSFTPNEKRSIANRFIPNERKTRLLCLMTKVFVAKYNRDGDRLITGSTDTLVRAYEASNGKYRLMQRHKIESADPNFMDLDISPCGRYFAYATHAKHFVIRSLCTNEEPEIIRYSSFRNTMFSIKYSYSGNTILGGCGYGYVYIYNYAVGNMYPLITGTTLNNNAVCFLSDQTASIILTACNKGEVKMWDLRCLKRTEALKPVSTFVGHLDAITSIDSRNDGRHFLTNSQDQCIKLWDTRQLTSNRLAEKKSNFHASSMTNLGALPISDASIMTYHGHRVSKGLLRAKFSPLEQTGQRYIYTGCSTGRIIIYDILTGEIKEAIESHRNVVTDVDWHPTRPEIISASWDGHVNLNGYSYRTPLGNVCPRRRSQRLRNRSLNYQSDDEDENFLDYSSISDSVRHPLI